MARRKSLYTSFWPYAVIFFSAIISVVFIGFGVYTWVNYRKHICDDQCRFQEYMKGRIDGEVATRALNVKPVEAPVTQVAHMSETKIERDVRDEVVQRDRRVLQDPL